jgi:hypothetical protein
MSLTFIGIIIFLILVIFSFFIEDPNLKLCYWLVLLLLALTIFNIILGFTYYKKLRNEPGVPGPRGSQGPSGARGANGKCTVSDQCEIPDCETKLVDMAYDIFPNIRKQCIKNFDSCSSEEQSLGRPLSSLIDRLANKCATTKMAEGDFMKRVRPKLVRLQDGEINN